MKPLKCDHCGKTFCEDDKYNYESVEEVGACLHCYDEHQELQREDAE